MANGDGFRQSWAANMLVVTGVQLQLGGIIAAPIPIDEIACC